VRGTAAATPRRRDGRAAAGGTCRLARSAAERERHFAIRRAVFVAEQRLFEGDDRDAIDAEPRTLHAIGLAGGRIGGAVRLYPLAAPGLWKGDRLAVLPALRHGLLGGELVRFAVRTAGERGGNRMVAMIQLPNVAFFEALGWRRAGLPRPYHGVAHQPMAIALGGRGSTLIKP
jgi:putative N-acetyltransferase (TIGR04045 family)